MAGEVDPAELESAFSQQNEATQQHDPQTPEAPVDKLGEAIESAFKEAAGEEAASPSRDERGRFAAKTEKPAATEQQQSTTVQPTEQEQQQAPATEVPAAWKSAARADLWKGLSPEAQKALVEREAEVSAGFKMYDGLGGYARICQANGTTLAQAMGSYRAVEEMLGKDFDAGIRAICQQYRIDPAHLAARLTGQGGAQPQQQDQGGQPQQFQPVNLEAIVDQRLRLTRAQEDVTAFWQKNPQAEEVADDMLAIIHREKAAGRPIDLAKIFEEARWLNPAHREALLNERDEATRKQALGKEQSAVQKARTLARSVGTAAPSAPTGQRGKKPTLDEAIGAAFDAVETAA